VTQFAAIITVDANVQIADRPMLPWNRPHPSPIGTGAVWSLAFGIIVDVDKIDREDVIALCDDIVEIIAGRVA
jgi:hypothetical protein